MKGNKNINKRYLRAPATTKTISNNNRIVCIAKKKMSTGKDKIGSYDD